MLAGRARKADLDSRHSYASVIFVWGSVRLIVHIFPGHIPDEPIAMTKPHLL
jgi:hypothetical protein